jgi:hypothetical protein
VGHALACLFFSSLLKESAGGFRYSLQGTHFEQEARMSVSRIPFLILTAATLCAQDPTVKTTPDKAEKTVALHGNVLATDGSPISNATVTISGQSTFVVVTQAGKYGVDRIPAGTYDIAAAEKHHRATAPKHVVLDGDKNVDFVLEPLCETCSPDKSKTAWIGEAWGTVWAVLLFLASIWLVRWHNIARPNRELLSSEIDNARVRFETETGSPVAKFPYLEALLLSAKQAIEWNRWTWLDFMFWSRGQEITGWSRIHEFQRDTIKLFAAGSLEMVRARLQAIELDLLDIDKTHAKTIAANIKDALEKSGQDESALRALLVESLTYLNDQCDSSFAQLVGWQTKAVWLAGLGCTLMIVLAFAVGNPVLFIAGAAGGYLSRLSRSLKRADVPSDYGASWTTLFLSPIVGALSGWFGILLIVILATSETKVLGAAFQSIQWGCPLAPFTLGVAFVMGFSERLFDGIISSLEKKVDSDREAANKPQQPTSKPDAGPKTPPPPPKADPAGTAKADAPAEQAKPDATVAPPPPADQKQEEKKE